LGIDISHYVLKNKSDLEKKWCELYLNSAHNIFLDWRWVDAWLNSIPIAPVVIEANFQSRCVGIGLLCRKTHRIFLRQVNVEQLWLYRCGDEKLDQMWIEHSDFLLHSQYEDEVRDALATHIKNKVEHWHEFYLGMSSNTLVRKFESVLGKPRVVITASDFEVDLNNIDNIESYLGLLSKNTRSQIVRSKKLLSKEGDINLRLAQTEQDKNVFFRELCKLHQKKWRKTVTGSGFDNTVFVEFHKQIIFGDIDNHYSGIYSLEINGKPLAFIYLLKNNHSWYFYLSGMETHSDNKIKIGLVAHTLLIQLALSNGIRTYSFLAGDARYKKSMSNNSDGIQELACFLKPSKLNYFLQKLRYLKSLLPLQHINRE
jgi:hypothetical protein